MSYRTFIMYIILLLAGVTASHIGMSVGLILKFRDSVESGVMHYEGKKYHVIPWEGDIP